MTTNFTVIIIGGGCWYGSAACVRVSNRVWYDPGVRDDDLGFRLVKG